MKIYRSRAPLRLGLAGGGTDVSPYTEEYGGLVLNVTIDKYAYVSIIERSDGHYSFTNADSQLTTSGPSSTILPVVSGLDLHCGVYNRVVKDWNKGRVLTVDVTTHSEAPPGSGLGSSSTVVVAMLKAYAEMLGVSIGDYELAQLAFDIERKDLAMSGGKQDQYAATFGGLNYIEFNAGSVVVNPLRLKASHKAEIEASLLLYFTGVSRSSANIIDQQVSQLNSGETKSVEAMHALKRDAVIMKEAILKGDYFGVAESMRRSWEAKKNTATSVSNSKIDQIFEAALAAGALAGKVSGAGGGGFMMFIVDPRRRAEVIRLLQGFDGTVMTCGFVERGAESWTA